MNKPDTIQVVIMRIERQHKRLDDILNNPMATARIIKEAQNKKVKLDEIVENLITETETRLN